MVHREIREGVENIVKIKMNHSIGKDAFKKLKLLVHTIFVFTSYWKDGINVLKW